MAEPLSSTSVSSTHLIGSQIETYQTLLTMGFAASEAVNVAEMFGSNVQGAIDCLFNGGAPTVSAPTDVTAHDIDNLTRLLSPKLKIHDKILRFRTTSLSHQFTNGYIRKHSDYVVPSVINDLIIHYSNLYFIKLNYNIRNDDDMEQKYTENTAVFVTECDTTLREIAIKIEKTTPYTYKDAMNDQPQYSYFVHIWIRLRFLKPIYPLNIENRRIHINMDDINACERANNCDPNRWIEIPNDFEEIQISEMDTLFTANAKDKYAVLELGIEKFNQNTKKWPFRDPNMVPTSDEILRPQPDKQKLKDNNVQIWKCDCGTRNDATYVFCARCYKDRIQQETEDASSTINIESRQITVEEIVAKAIQKYTRKVDQLRAIRKDLAQYFPNDSRASALALGILSGSTHSVDELQDVPSLSLSGTSPINSPRDISHINIKAPQDCNVINSDSHRMPLLKDDLMNRRHLSYITNYGVVTNYQTILTQYGNQPSVNLTKKEIHQNRKLVSTLLDKRLAVRKHPVELEERGVLPKDYFDDPQAAYEMRQIQRKLAKEDLKRNLKRRMPANEIVQRGIAPNGFLRKSPTELRKERRKEIKQITKQSNEKLHRDRRPNVHDLIAKQIIPEDNDVIQELKNIAHTHKLRFDLEAAQKKNKKRRLLNRHLSERKKKNELIELGIIRKEEHHELKNKKLQSLKEAIQNRRSLSDIADLGYIDDSGMAPMLQPIALRLNRCLRERKNKNELIALGIIITKEEHQEKKKKKKGKQNKRKKVNYGLWIQHLAVGDIIDVKDEKDKWYEAVIRCMKCDGKKTLLYVHYIGWNNKWDESIIAEDMTRIAKRGTHTVGPHRPTKRTLNSNTPRLVYPYYRKCVDEAACHK